MATLVFAEDARSGTAKSDRAVGMNIHKPGLVNLHFLGCRRQIEHLSIRRSHDPQRRIDVTDAAIEQKLLALLAGGDRGGVPWRGEVQTGSFV